MNNYVSKFKITVKLMFQTTATNFTGVICINFMNMWRIPEMDTCMGLVAPASLTKKNTTLFTNGRIFAETTSVYFYMDTNTRIKVSSTPLTFAPLKCHPETDEVRIYKPNVEIAYDPVLTAMTMNRPQSYFVTNDFWTDSSKMIDMLVMAPNYTILKDETAVTFANNLI